MTDLLVHPYRYATAALTLGASLIGIGYWLDPDRHSPH